MSSPSSSGRRRTTSRQYSAEDQALDQIAREAEQRLAARRAARAEARDIRMKELEKQQKEAEEKQDRHFTLGVTDHKPARTYASSRRDRRGSDDSTTSDASNTDSREIRKELSELEDKYKKAMMNNAQLDNEKQSFRYQVELLKDQMEELEEQWLELQREHKERCRELDGQKRDNKDLKFECSYLKEQLQQRDTLIEEYGLVFISDDTIDNNDKDKSKKNAEKKNKPANKQDGVATADLVTPEAAEILRRTEGTLDERLKTMEADKTKLEQEVKKLKQQLEEEKEKSALAEKYSTPKSQSRVNGPDMQALEAQMEAQRQISEYKFKLKKAEQDITTLEGNVVRLESQVKRFKTSSENSEKQEEELKAEKRKLQRELREANNTIEEVQTQNHHLQKRLEKIKSARNALAKP